MRVTKIYLGYMTSVPMEENLSH